MQLSAKMGTYHSISVPRVFQDSRFVTNETSQLVVWTNDLCVHWLRHLMIMVQLLLRELLLLRTWIIAFLLILLSIMHSTCTFVLITRAMR